MAGLYFEHNGLLNDWTAANNIEVVDAGQPLLSYDAEPDGHGVKSHPLREVTDFIARMISSLPLKVYKREPDGGRSRVREGPLAMLVANPSGNPAIPPSMFWYALIQDGLLADRYLAIIDQTANGLRLKRIPARRWRPTVDDFDEPTGAKVWIDPANPARFDIHTDGIIMNVGYAFASGKGEPKRRRLREILEEYDASLKYRAEVNRHGIRSPLVIERDKPWPDATSRERFQRGMKQFTNGQSGAGGGMLLDDGMHATALNGFKPIDVDDLNARDKVKIDVANAYGIPPEIIGIREGNFQQPHRFQADALRHLPGPVHRQPRADPEPVPARPTADLRQGRIPRIRPRRPTARRSRSPIQGARHRHGPTHIHHQRGTRTPPTRPSSTRAKASSPRSTCSSAARPAPTTGKPKAGRRPTAR